MLRDGLPFCHVPFLRCKARMEYMTVGEPYGRCELRAGHTTLHCLSRFKRYILWSTKPLQYREKR